MALSSPSSTSNTALQHGDEFRLLCALATTALTEERLERLATCNLSALDWKEFFRRAEHHGLLPFVAHNLIADGRREGAQQLPVEIERDLRSAYDANLRRNLWFSAELARIMKHFELRQLGPIPFKGPALAESLYHDVALRSFNDLDFLIAPEQVEAAKQALAEIAYHPSEDLTPPVERFWLRYGNERAFDGAAGRYLVELQWALLPYFYCVGLRVEDLIARASGRPVGGNKIPSLSPEDSLLVLSLHAAKHLWTRLIWLVDVAETLRTQTIDYPLALSRACALGIARILAVNFWLVKNVLHTELPRAAEELIAADPQVQMLGNEIAGRLANGVAYDFESTEYFRLILKLRERRGDRWRYLWRLVWTPSVGDLAATRLPEALFQLYRGVRIVRLIGKLAR